MLIAMIVTVVLVGTGLAVWGRVEKLHRASDSTSTSHPASTSTHESEPAPSTDAEPLPADSPSGATATPISDATDGAAPNSPTRRNANAIVPGPNLYTRFGEVTAKQQDWFKRNGYPDDAEAELLRSMDINSLRAKTAKGDLAAQTELAYRLSRHSDTQTEAAAKFRNAAAKGSKEALGRAADAFEQSTVCSNAVTGNAYRQVAVMLGDLNALPKYAMCVHGLTAEEQAMTLAFAARLFQDLNQQSMFLTGHPLQIDSDPRTEALIDRLGNVQSETGEGDG